jgi:hypothetical protein
LIRQRPKIQNGAGTEFTTRERIVQRLVGLFTQLGLIDLCDSKVAHNVTLSDVEVSRLEPWQVYRGQIY